MRFPGIGLNELYVKKKVEKKRRLVNSLAKDSGYIHANRLPSYEVEIGVEYWNSSIGFYTVQGFDYEHIYINGPATRGRALDYNVGGIINEGEFKGCVILEPSEFHCQELASEYRARVVADLSEGRKVSREVWIEYPEIYAVELEKEDDFGRRLVKHPEQTYDYSSKREILGYRLTELRKENLKKRLLLTEPEQVLAVKREEEWIGMHNLGIRKHTKHYKEKLTEDFGYKWPSGLPKKTEKKVVEVKPVLEAAATEVVEDVEEVVDVEEEKVKEPNLPFPTLEVIKLLRFGFAVYGVYKFIQSF